MILGSGKGRNESLDASRISDADVEKVKTVLQEHGMHVSALQVGADSINPRFGQASRF